VHFQLFLIKKSLTIDLPVNRITRTMIRRLIGALLCFVMMTAVLSSAYAEAVKMDGSFDLRFETSYVALDPLDDSNDAPYPDGIISYSPRGNAVVKLTLAIRKIRFTPPAVVFFERPAHSGLTSQDLFRYEKVYRI
jgi:hypothetical protein